MSNFLSLPVLALAAILQVTVIPRVSVLGGRPDLVLLIVLSWTLNGSLEEGVVWAFVGGLCTDLLSAAPLGTSAAGMVILAFMVHAVRQQLYTVGIFTLIWVVLLGTLFQHLSITVILVLTGFAPAFAGRLGYGVIVQQMTTFVFPTMIYNLVVILPTYGMIRRIQMRVDTDKRRFTS
jgi:rod shape-determining protein MreD